MRHHSLSPLFLIPCQVLFITALLAACGPRFSPRGPATEPAQPPPTMATPPASAELPVTAPAQAVSPSPVRRPLARQILIGEMCPRAAGGRPAVMPLFLRALTWSLDGEDVSLPIERRTARSFSVLGWDGRRAGVFSVAGAADVGAASKAAIGAYAGESPCSLATTDGSRQTDATCVRAQSGCGLALAVVEASSAMAPYDEDPEPLEMPVAGACTAGGFLLVDIDGDGTREAYPAATFLDPLRAPAEEVLAAPAGGATCQPVFAQRGVLPARDPKHFRGLDLLGVMDIDSDGRNELIVVYHYEDRRTWAVYTATATAARLELVGEAPSWSVR